MSQSIPHAITIKISHFGTKELMLHSNNFVDKKKKKNKKKKKKQKQKQKGTIKEF